ncbi:MAG TPA: hypothetical protein V6C85_27875 [Allocoleopsis sp.]
MLQIYHQLLFEQQVMEIKKCKLIALAESGENAHRHSWLEF